MMYDSMYDYVCYKYAYHVGRGHLKINYPQSLANRKCRVQLDPWTTGRASNVKPYKLPNRRPEK